MKKSILANTINKIINEHPKESLRKTITDPYIILYVDAKPSESIQKHEIPGLGVAAIFVYGKDGTIVNVPIKQYKEYSRSEKAAKALELKNWMREEREKNNLSLVGFMNALDQTAAARIGLDLIEELPNTRIENNYNQYRLFFGDEYIDFAHAVALVYYMITVSFAIGRVASSIDKAHREHIIALLDRFPDANKGDSSEMKAPTTQGMKFVKFLKANSKTFMDIDTVNRNSGIAYRLDSLEGWKNRINEKWKDPKKHPHFTLVDWLVVAAIAHRYPEKFIADFKSTKLGKKGQNAEDAQRALGELYLEFKKHKIFAFADEHTLGMIKSDTKLWAVPNEAKQFIYDRAAG